MSVHPVASEGLQDLLQSENQSGWTDSLGSLLFYDKLKENCPRNESRYRPSLSVL